jgi:protein TonB
MGYQALLFCPDEKLARVVSQVFAELDFTIEPVHEPFAAVKKLMAQRYDAIVVDCENEQNASLLFKSARNSSSNQSSLAIALVEGQAGVAKAYRIGANLVLTKPINLEQAKGTLRVARGLLRKNSDAASASASSAAAPAMPAKSALASEASSLQPASRGAAAITPTASRNELPEFEAPLPADLPAGLPAALPAMTTSAEVDDQPAIGSAPAALAQTEPTQTQAQIKIAAQPAVETREAASLQLIKNDVVKNDGIKSEVTKSEVAKIAAASSPAQPPTSAFTSLPSSAAAPAPAKEVAAASAKQNTTVESEPTAPSDAARSDAAPSPAAPAQISSSVSVSDAPTFAALGEAESGGSGQSKKILIAAVIILALGALGYFGYGKLGTSSPASTPPPVSTRPDSGQPAPVPASSAVATPSTSMPDRASSTTQTSAPKPAPPDKPSAGTGNSPVSRISLSPEPATKQPDSAPISAPIVVKSNTVKPKTHGQTEESAPPLPSSLEVASADDSNLSGLMQSSSNVDRPSLAALKISQGVSQGLLIKQVQPKYPRAALTAHATGAVQIQATINKEGVVTNLKVLSGDPILASAALEAVRQWRYKPYYLDGDPVEIQTQITVKFKAN